MAYCGPRGIPLHEFLSWPRMSQDAALEWAAYEARRCRSCGTHPDEGKRHAHTDVCHGCIRVEKATKNASDVDGAHVHLVAGAITDCPRCMTEREANKRG